MPLLTHAMFLAMRRSIYPVAIAVVIALLTTSSVRGEGESRIWTDSTGKHQIRAKFVDLKDGQVRLERPNGSISRIPLDKLSKEDQAVVRDLGKKKNEQTRREKEGLVVGDRVEAKIFREWEPGTVAGIDYDRKRVEVQFDDKPEGFEIPVDLDEVRWPDSKKPVKLGDPNSAGATASDAQALGGLKLTPTDKSEVIRLVASGSSATQVSPDPGPGNTGSWKPRAARLADRADVFEHPVDFSISGGDQPKAMILTSLRRQGRDRPMRVELVDLKTRRQLLSGNAPPGSKKVAFSPSGKHALTLPEKWSASEDPGQVDFWNIEGKTISHWFSFQPYAPKKWPERNIEWIEWLDDERVFTANGRGVLYLWHVEDAKAVYELPIESRAVPALSPGRKQLAVPTKQGIHVFETGSGDLLATVGDRGFVGARLAFSPSGKQIACASAGFIDVVDLTTGETTRSFPSKAADSGRTLWWIDEQHLFVNSSDIVDVPRRITLWKFNIQSQLVKPFDGTPWALLEDRHNDMQMLTPFELPIKEAVDAAAGLGNDQLLAVKPGMGISIEVRVSGDRLLADEVRKSLTEAVTDAGLKAGDNQSLKLIASMTHGETRDVTYQFFGHRQKDQTIKVTDRVYKLEMQVSGATVWEHKSTQQAPHHLRLEENESVQDGIRRSMKPTKHHFGSRLPAYVVKPEYQEPLGTSELSIR